MYIFKYKYTFQTYFRKILAWANIDLLVQFLIDLMKHWGHDSRYFWRNSLKGKSALSLRFAIDSFNAALKGTWIMTCQLYKSQQFTCSRWVDLIVVPIKRTQFQVSGWTVSRSSLKFSRFIPWSDRYSPLDTHELLVIVIKATSPKHLSNPMIHNMKPLIEAIR